MGCLAKQPPPNGARAHRKSPRDCAAPDLECREGAAGVRCRVLVVDDHETLAESVARALRKYGHEVRTALDGRAALEELETFRPQIVFLDIGLPRLDGLALAARLRNKPAFRDTVLVAVTGYDDEEMMTRVRQVFDHCLIKPPSLSVLQALIQAAASEGADEGPGPRGQSGGA